MFKNIPNDDLRTNIQFNAHALNIVTTLTAIIDKLGEPELAAAMSKKIGASHQPRKLTEVHFNVSIVKTFIWSSLFVNSFQFNWVCLFNFFYSLKNCSF